MARIPMGDFGATVARPVEQDRISPAAYGAGVGQALEQAGERGMAIARQEQAAQDAEARQAAREAEAEARQATRIANAEARATEREARRVKALTAQATITNGLADLHDQVDNDLRTGALDKSRALAWFNDSAGKLTAKGLEAVDPEHRDLVNATVLDNVGRMRGSVAKMVQARDRQDVLAGGLSYFEEMQRYAARGGAQADEAINNVRTFWTATGPMAGETPAQASQRVQQFAERVRFQQATALVNADPGAALKALKNPGYLPELDPGQRTSLLHTADSRVLQAQQRAAIQADAAARQQSKAWEAAVTVLQAGKVLEPAYAAQLQQQFKGTPYAQALDSLMADGPRNVAFASQPVAAQTQLLLDMQARMNKQGANPDDLKAYEQMDRTHKATLADIKEDPYKAAVERGVLTAVAPLTFDLRVLPQQLVQRARDAQVVSQWTGREESLFRPAEAGKVADLLTAMPPKDRAGALQALGSQMTPGQMRSFAQQLGAKDDKLAAATISAAQGAKTTAGRPVAEIILAGADALKDQRVKWPSGMDATAVRMEIDRQTRGAFLSEASQRAAGDAAEAVFAGLLAEGQTPDVSQAVRLATGGIMDMNGQRLVKPWGWTDGMVLKSLRDIDAPRVAALTGGQPARLGDKALQPEELARLMPGAQLGPSPRPGAYTVSIGGRMVMAPNGRPLIVPLEAR
jgi:hypothetical protein